MGEILKVSPKLEILDVGEIISLLSQYKVS